MNRRVRVCFDGQTLVWFLTNERYVRAALVANGLPEDARFVRCWDEKGTINLAFEHESFPPSDEDNLPILTPVFFETRSLVDRRSGLDRRVRTIEVQEDRRVNAERRVQGDRRKR